MAISIRAFMCAEFVGAAALALWTVAVFPRLGPKSLRGALTACVAAFALLEFLPPAVLLALRLPHGAYVALFAGVLPVVFGAFLSMAWLMRALAGALGGSGGGGGHRVPATARN